MLLKTLWNNILAAWQRAWAILSVLLNWKVIGVALVCFAAWRVHLEMYARCGLDNGGSWSVGIATGSSPFSLIVNPFPSMDCSLVADELVSFIADPFLINFPRRSATWYMFFEAKSSASWHGDIGMAVSNDHGETWLYHSIIIDETFHLSYPFVVEDVGWDGISQEGVYILPESYQANSIRVYKPVAWPRKWMYVQDLLTGKPFVDSSLVYFKDHWWIFTMVDNQLLLYMGVKLKKAKAAKPGMENSFLVMDWVEHPRSPIRDSSCSWRRPGGRPVVHDGVLYVFAQDDSKTYGGAVRVLRVTSLTPGEYAEEFVTAMHPESELEEASEIVQERIRNGNLALRGGTHEDNFNNQHHHHLAGTPFHWVSKRIHHVDAHQISPGHWIASVDGDSQLNKTPMMRAILTGVFALLVFLVCKYDLLSRLTAHFPALQQTASLAQSQQKEMARLVKSYERHLRWTVRLVGALLGALLVVTLVSNRWDTKPIVADYSGLDELIVRNPDSAQNADFHSMRGGLVDYAPSKGRVEKLQTPLDDCPLTMVTGLYDVGRGEFQGETRGWKDYLRYFEQILDLNTCMVVHVDYSTVEFVKERRRHQLSRTVIVAENWTDIVQSYPYRDAMQRILNDKDFLSRVKRPGRPEMKLVGYNIVMFKKVDWVHDASLANPFHSKYFFWFDAGYGHGKMMGFLKGKVWPDPAKVNAIMNSEQIYILRVRDFVRQECRVEKQMFTRHVKTVAGGFFGGASVPIQRLYVGFHAALQRSLEGGYMDDDQAVFFGTWCDDPSLFVFEDCPRNLLCTLLDIKPCWDSWNCPVRYFAPDSSS